MRSRWWSSVRSPTRPRSTLVAVVAVALGGALVGALVGEFPDLSVYRYGGRSVLDGVAPYAARDPVTGYPFTYPPFAAVAMVPLALLPGGVAAACWLGASVGCLAAAVVVARRADGGATAGWVLVLVVVATLGLEPVWQNFRFGQVNTFVMLAVLVDLTRPERRTSGVLLGIVAGIKLTPLVFVPLLLLVGHVRAAVRAVLTFAGTVVVGVLVMPQAAMDHWTDGLLDPSRVGPPELAHNQSVSGALTRMGGDPSTALWIAVAAPVALAALLLAAAWWRRGERVWATCLGALAMLLASPVSWSHHWVWAAVVAVALWDRHRVVAAAWVAVFVARPMLWPPWGEGRELDWRWFEHVAGNAYVVAAVALAAWSGLRLVRGPHPAVDTTRTEPDDPDLRVNGRRGDGR